MRDIAALMGLVLLACIVLIPTLVSDKIAWNTQGVLQLPPWQEARAEQATPAPLSDEALRYYPWYAFLNQAAHNDQSILWNPLEGAGAPFFGAWRTRAMSPFSIPLYLLPLDTALRLIALIKLIVAAWTMYYVSRKLGFSVPLAFAAAVAVQFSAFNLIWMNRPASDVIIWMPFLVLTAERLAIGQTRLWTLPAIVVALMAAGGDPEQLAGALLFGLIYLTLRLILGRAGTRPTVESLVFYAIAVTAGLALLAVQIAPFIELTREAAATGRADSSTAVSLRDAIVAFFPNFPVTDQPHSANVIKLLHIGLIPLWCLPVWFSLRKFIRKSQRHRIEAMLLSAAVMTALALVGNNLPLLRHLGAKDLLCGNVIAFALMAAATAEEWLLLNAEQCRVVIRRLQVFVLFFFIVAATTMLANTYTSVPGVQPLWLQTVLFIVFSMAFLILLLATLIRPSLMLMGYGLAALIFVSSMQAFHSELTFQPTHAVFPRTSFTAALEAQNQRIAGGQALASWPLAANFIPQAYCPSGLILKRQQAFLEQAQADPLLLRRTGTPTLLLTKQAIQGPFAPLRPTLAIEKVFETGAVLFKDLHAEPTARIITKWRKTDDPEGAEIRSTLPPLIEGADLVPPPHFVEARATVKQHSNTTTTVEVDLSESALLVLAQAYYPGWIATIHGESQPILAADNAFSAVELKAGRYSVNISYTPWSLWLGLYITIAAAIIVLFEMRHVLYLVITHIRTTPTA